MKRFLIGQAYTKDTYIITIQKRTDKTVTYLLEGESKRRAIHRTHAGNEYIIDSTNSTVPVFMA